MSCCFEGAGIRDAGLGIAVILSVSGATSFRPGREHKFARRRTGPRRRLRGGGDAGRTDAVAGIAV